MRKLNYQEPKVQELIEVLQDLKFEFEKCKDSLDVKVSRDTKKVLSHELSKINGMHKTPPLSSSYDEASGVVSVFDSRL